MRRWKPIDYRSYFGVSALRRAAAALCAYDALPDQRRFIFEKLIRAMDQLADMAILALDLKEDRETAAFVPTATAPIVRRLIARAASFLNSGGADVGRPGAIEEAQEAIDRLNELLRPDGRGGVGLGAAHSSPANARPLTTRPAPSISRGRR